MGCDKKCDKLKRRIRELEDALSFIEGYAGRWKASLPQSSDVFASIVDIAKSARDGVTKFSNDGAGQK